MVADVIAKILAFSGEHLIRCRSAEVTVKQVRCDAVLCHLRNAVNRHGFQRGRVAATMGPMSSLPLQFLLLTVAGWMTRDQQRVTEYLLAENAVLRLCHRPREPACRGRGHRALTS
jgi:hypothetical protein